MGEGEPYPKLLYEGKSKRLFLLGGDEALMEFKDEVTAYNGRYRDIAPAKGRLSALLSSRLFEELEDNGVRTHYVCYEGGNRVRVRLLKILPLEIVVRNYAYGSMVKRIPIVKPLEPIRPPLVELHYKDDSLGDPLLHPRDPVIAGLLEAGEAREIEELATRVNSVLARFWGERGLRLVDFKIEVAKTSEGFVVADEISGDTMRLIDVEGNHLDKEIYRRSRDVRALLKAYEDLARLAGEPRRWC